MISHYILTNTKDQTQRKFDRLKRTTVTTGLTSNVGKTKMMKLKTDAAQGAMLDRREEEEEEEMESFNTCTCIYEQQLLPKEALIIT